MSRTTEVKAVPIKDFPALVAAVAQLNEQGIKCTLEANAKPRMYYERQQVECPYVLKMTEGKYDIGFQKVEGAEELRMIFDDHGGYLSDFLAPKNTPRPDRVKQPAQHALWPVAALSLAYSQNALANMSTLAGRFLIGRTTTGPLTHFQFA